MDRAGDLHEITLAAEEQRVATRCRHSSSKRPVTWSAANEPLVFSVGPMPTMVRVVELV